MKDQNNDKDKPGYEYRDDLKNTKSDSQLGRIPKIGEDESSGIHDNSDPHQPTLTPAGWFLGAIFFLLPTIVLWGVHRLGWWPTPCWWYGAWTIVLLVAAVCAGAATASQS